MKRLAVLLAAMFLSICLVRALPCTANVSASGQGAAKHKTDARMQTFKAKHDAWKAKRESRKIAMKHKRSVMMMPADKSAAKEHKKAFESKVAAWKEKANNAKAGRGGSHE